MVAQAARALVRTARTSAGGASRAGGVLNSNVQERVATEFYKYPAVSKFVSDECQGKVEPDHQPARPSDSLRSCTAAVAHRLAKKVDDSCLSSFASGSANGSSQVSGHRALEIGCVSPTVWGIAPSHAARQHLAMFEGRFHAPTDIIKKSLQPLYGGNVIQQDGELRLHLSHDLSSQMAF